MSPTERDHMAQQIALYAWLLLPTNYGCQPLGAEINVRLQQLVRAWGESAGLVSVAGEVRTEAMLALARALIAKEAA